MGFKILICLSFLLFLKDLLLLVMLKERYRSANQILLMHITEYKECMYVVRYILYALFETQSSQPRVTTLDYFISLKSVKMFWLCVFCLVFKDRFFGRLQRESILQKNHLFLFIINWKSMVAFREHWITYLLDAIHSAGT